MSWNTELFCNITFSRETFNYKSEVEDRIEETEKLLQTMKDQIRNFVMMTEPRKFCPENYDPLIWINNEYEDLMASIEEYSIELYKLRILLDNWDNCHEKDGLAICPPDDITWKTAFLDGDFVKTTKYPNPNDFLTSNNE